MDKVSNTFCVLPWSHLHAWPDGKAMLCCIANGGKNMGEVGDFSQNNYQEIINSDKLKQVRLDMLAGKRVEQCKACYSSEDMGQSSFRINKNYEFRDHIEDLLARTKDDGTIENPTMLYMDFRFSNLCNLGCRTCGHQLSSNISNNMTDELKRARLLPLKEKNVLSDKGTVTSFVYARPNFMNEDVYPYIKDVKGFYFAGGEPLLHPEHYDIMMYLLDNNMTDKSITYSTNMTTFSWKKTDFLEVWKKFDHILFFCSIDSYGDKLEYIRDRTKNDVVMGNLKKLLDLKKEGRPGQFKVEICYTHSIFNAYDTREFFDYLDEIGLMEDICNVELNFAYGDDLSLAILPSWAKKELKEKRLKDLESESLQKAFDLWPRMKKAWFNVDKLIDEESDKPLDILLNRDLFDYEKAKDSLPWLASVVKRYKIV